MTAPRWQKVFSDLWGARQRSLTVIASISVGLFAIGVIANLYVVIQQDMRTGFIAVNAANIYIESTPFDQDMVAALRRVEGVRQAEGVNTFSLRTRTSVNTWESTTFQAVDDWAAMPMNHVTLLEGKWPPAKGEVVVDQYKRPDLHAGLGDTLRVEISEGVFEELTLVGVVQDLTIGAYSGGGGFFYAPVIAYIDPDTLASLGKDPEQYNAVYATVTGAGSDAAWLTTMATRLTSKMEDSDLTILLAKTRRSDDHPNAYLINAIIGVLLVIGLLVVFLSTFLITNTLQSLLGQQIIQIGIMKSVGARQFQVAGIYMALILFFGLLAFAISAPLSHVVSYVLLNFLASSVNVILQGERVIPPVIILQGALALIMPQLAAWAPIMRGTSIPVQQALSGVGPGEASRKHTHTDPAARRRGLARVFSRPFIIAVRNTFRRKGRLALTLITLTLGGAVFIATFNVRISLDNYILQISQYFLSDVNITLDRPYRVSKMVDILGSVEGVSYVEGWAAASCQIVQADGGTGDSVQLLAPPADSRLVEPVLLDGRWLLPGDRDKITLGELFQMLYPDLRVGDPINLMVNGEETTFTVVGFFQLSGNTGGYTAYTNFETLTELTGQSNKAISFQVVADRGGLTADEQDTLAHALEQRLEAEGIHALDFTTGAYLSGLASSAFTILTGFLLFMAILTAMVGSIGLAGTMSMNVVERTREIGVMRAIGASDSALIRMVLVEGMIIGAISYVLGGLLSFPISKLLADGITMSVFGAPSTFGFSPLGFFIWLAAVVVLSAGASIIPARGAARLTIREVLSYE